MSGCVAQPEFPTKNTSFSFSFLLASIVATRACALNSTSMTCYVAANPPGSPPMLLASFPRFSLVCFKGYLSQPIAHCYFLVKLLNETEVARIDELKESLDVLFQFSRIPTDDGGFALEIAAWTEQVAAVLVRVAPVADHQYLLHHLIRFVVCHHVLIRFLICLTSIFSKFAPRCWAQIFQVASVSTAGKLDRRNGRPYSCAVIYPC
jgi:hypothetical protein